MNTTYLSLFAITIVALLSPWISARLMRGLMPTIVIEILLGVLIGPDGLRLAQSTTDIQFLASFGFSYLLFLSGFELDFNLLTEPDLSKGSFSPPWLRALEFFGVVFGISAVVAYGLSALGVVRFPFMVSLLLTTVALGIVMPTLRETGWIRSPYGQEILRFAVLADILSLLILSGYVTLHTSGNVVSVLWVFVLIVAFLLMARLLRWTQRFPWASGLRTSSSEIGIRGTFALILLFLALSVLLGTAVVVGAFLAGATLSLVSNQASAVTPKLHAIGYGFLLPVFFVNVGMTFHLHQLMNSLAHGGIFVITLVVLFLGHYLAKIVPGWFFFREYPLRQRWAGGILLGSQLSLIVAAVELGQQIGVLTPAVANGYLLIAVVTCLMSPALFIRLLGAAPVTVDEPSVQEAVVLGGETLPEGWEADRIEVRSRRLQGLPLRLLRLPGDVLFVSIIRNQEVLVPRGGTSLMQFDLIQVLGHPDSIRRIRSMMERV